MPSRSRPVTAEAACQVQLKLCLMTASRVAHVNDHPADCLKNYFTTERSYKTDCTPPALMQPLITGQNAFQSTHLHQHGWQHERQPHRQAPQAFRCCAVLPHARHKSFQKAVHPDGEHIDAITTTCHIKAEWAQARTGLRDTLLTAG